MAVKSLFDVGSSIAKVFKGDTSGIQVAPEPRWLDPPARASYRVETLRTEKAETAGTEWAEVDVDPGASSWLDRVVDASSRVFRGMSLEVSTVDAWLDTDGEAPDRRRIVVHIGAQRVGTVEGSRAAPYREAMAAAAARHELPVPSRSAPAAPTTAPPPARDRLPFERRGAVTIVLGEPAGGFGDVRRWTNPGNQAWTGGRRVAQGPADSICDASRMRRSSRP